MILSWFRSGADGGYWASISEIPEGPLILIRNLSANVTLSLDGEKLVFILLDFCSWVTVVQGSPSLVVRFPVSLVTQVEELTKNLEAPNLPQRFSSVSCRSC